MRRTTWQDWRLMVRVVCAIALVFVAFAHKPIAVASENPIDLAAYTLPDGSVPVLCLPGSGDQDAHKDALHGKNCEACRLSASFNLPVPHASSGAKVEPAKSLAIKREAVRIARSLYPPSAPPQAPPLA